MNLRRRSSRSLIRKRRYGRRYKSMMAAPGKYLLQSVYAAGKRAGMQGSIPENCTFAESRVQQSFVRWCSAHLKGRPEYSAMKRMSAAFVRGYRQTSGISISGLPLLLKGRAGAVVCASNEAASLDLVLTELERLPLHELIVILNGCHDDSYMISRKHRQATIVHFHERLGHDVGRSIGAEVSSADVLLFTDGDIAISAEHLAPFLYEVDGGCDMALNDLNPYLPPFVHQDEVTRFKSFLNIVLGQEKLGANSLTAVPHAVSRRLLEHIGTEPFMVPPKAQALAASAGYHIKAVHSVNVLAGNRIRTSNTGKGNEVAEMIIGDHAEALYELQQRVVPAQPFLGTLSRQDVARRRNAP